MRNLTMKLFMPLLFSVVATGCTKPYVTTTKNPYEGTWESTYVYKSGYTNAYFMPTPVKFVTNTMTIREDGSYNETANLVYADDEVSSVTYSGTYTYTDSEITFRSVAGIAEGKTIPESRLPKPETYVRQKKTMSGKEIYYAESPERDEKNELKWPIVLTFLKTN